MSGSWHQKHVTHSSEPGPSGSGPILGTETAKLPLKDWKYENEDSIDSPWAHKTILSFGMTFLVRKTDFEVSN